MQIFGFLGSFLGYILWGAFYLLKDFGLSIIVFTVLIKIILFPFSVKQQKSMAGTVRMQKKQKELQEKYKNNKQLLQEETAKLYEKEGVKPMGGCVTMIIPMIIIFGIFYAVAYPITNTLHINSNDVSNALSYVNTIPGYASSGNATYQEINLLKIFPNIMNTDAIQSIFTSSEISTISMFGQGFNTFGIDLLAVPKDFGLFSPMILFPVFCFLSNVGAQFIMTKINGNAMAQQQGCMKYALYIIPLFSAYIAYTVPSAVAFYWIISSLISLIQSILLGKLFSPAQLTAKTEAAHLARIMQEESNVKYMYAPRETVVNTNTNKKKKK